LIPFQQFAPSETSHVGTSYDLVVDNSLVTSKTTFGATRDGFTQLRRHWPAESPKAAILLVHGIGEHSGRYEHVGAQLASRGYDTLGFDNRGYGQSGGRRAFVERFSQFSEDVEDLLNERRKLGVSVVLMGHSLGGLISTDYLISDLPQPDLAVLSAPALSAEVPVWQRIAAPTFGRLTPKLFIPQKIAGALLSRDPEVASAYENDPLVIKGATAGLGYEIFQAMERAMAGIERIKVPTYVLHGADDRLVPTEASEPLGALPNVTRKVWPGLLHESMNEPEQEEVIGAIADWLDSQL
jgi:acylglycerol lipase